MRHADRGDRPCAPAVALDDGLSRYSFPARQNPAKAELGHSRHHATLANAVAQYEPRRARMQEVVVESEKHAMDRFEILAGLPLYGTLALPFPSDGTGRYREGLVVRFNPASAGPWVGNFQRGATRYDSVLAHPDGRQVVIVAGGQGYVIDPETRSEMPCLMPPMINLAISMPEFNQIVLGTDLEFGVIRADGTGWKSARLSWDGITNVAISATTLTGEAYSPLDDAWHPFTLDLLTGESLGGSYPTEFAREDRSTD
jgi:hypothetical protein